MTELNIARDQILEVIDKLIAKKLTIATAESCTGGWLAQVLTSEPGSSSWFQSGFVTYSNESKQSLLNVPSEFFGCDGAGAVSEEVVTAMAEGVIAICKTNLAITISGIAGPEGGTREKPVGTVWIAWCWEQEIRAKRFLFAGDRAQVRRAAVEAALLGILELVS